MNEPAYAAQQLGQYGFCLELLEHVGTASSLFSLVIYALGRNRKYLSFYSS